MPFYTVVSQAKVPAAIETCWQHLTDPVLIGRWFADVEGTVQPGSECEYQFGDGDFFRAQTLELQAPLRLHMTWRFMGVGAVSDIEYVLLPHASGTDVSVIDRGPYSRGGALELREGWADFLSRLVTTIETGKNARYRWSEVIGAGTLVRATAAETYKRLSDPSLWEGAFPQTSAVVEASPNKVVVTLINAAWEGKSTRARLCISERGQATGISVSHEGWLELPASIQFEERKRFAGYWAALLLQIESLLGHAGRNEYSAPTC